jgi:aspartate kinase
MLVFKFGGASVKEAEAVRNVASIIDGFKGQKLFVIVSAMGKTTNKLEELLHAYLNNEPTSPILDEVKSFHHSITDELIDDKNSYFYEVENLLIELECVLDTPPRDDEYDYYYDKIVSYGELLSTRIISHYLNTVGQTCRWMDARNFIITSNEHRKGRVDWNSTSDLIKRRVKPILEKQIVVSQGFIGRSQSNQTVTLGREGSDYSAAIFAYGLDAESVTIWKDVQGFMNADPKRVAATKLIPEMKFKEAIELAYYGASVVHPKTIQPLRRKSIPLYIRSFHDIDAPSTIVSDFEEKSKIETACYIYKENQAHISLSTKDFSFVVEDNLSNIFAILAKYNCQVNMMQNSAISFRFCTNYNAYNFDSMIEELKQQYHVQFDLNMQLLTIYNQQSDELSHELLNGQNVVMEQHSEKVVQYVLEKLN